MCSSTLAGVGLSVGKQTDEIGDAVVNRTEEETKGCDIDRSVSSNRRLVAKLKEEGEKKIPFLRDDVWPHVRRLNRSVATLPWVTRRHTSVHLLPTLLRAFSRNKLNLPLNRTHRASAADRHVTRCTTLADTFRLKKKSIASPFNEPFPTPPTPSVIRETGTRSFVRSWNILYCLARWSASFSVGKKKRTTATTIFGEVIVLS